MDEGSVVERLRQNLNAGATSPHLSRSDAVRLLTAVEALDWIGRATDD